MGKKKSQVKNNKKQSATKGQQLKPLIEPCKVTLFTHPLVTLKITAILLGSLLQGTLNFIKKHVLSIIALVGALCAFLYAPGPHDAVSQDINIFKDP